MTEAADLTAEEVAILEDKLSDPWWRLTSGEVYKIKTADGRGIIPFQPREEQKELLRKLLDAVGVVRDYADRLKAAGGDYTAVEPIQSPQEAEIKSRRLGYSTTIGVFVADCLGFRKSFVAQLVDQTADDAAKKMNGIVKVALNSLIELGWPLVKIKDNDSELTVDLQGQDEAAPSSFFAGVKGRGGSVDFGWYSELGVIQFDDPPRAEEIITGSFPAARHGVKWVESTWKGGEGGALWDLIKPTLNGVANDWRVHFTPWYRDPRNVSPHAMHDAESIAYFASIEERLQKEGITLSDAQKRWYAQERRTCGIFMKRENPTFLDECWTAPIEGAIYAAALARARTEGRVGPMPVHGGSLVNTSWDKGSPLQTICWYWQVVGREIRVVDCDVGYNGTLTQRVAHMQGKGYAFGTHYLPHDAKQTESTGKTFATELSAAGIGKIVCVPKTADVWDGINWLLELFPSLAFREPACVDGLKAITAYAKKPKKDGAREEPLHNWASHPADALRTMAEAHKAGFFKFNGGATQGSYYDAGPRKSIMKPQRVSA